MNPKIILTSALIFGVSARNRTRVHGDAMGWMVNSWNFEEQHATATIDVNATKEECVSGDGPCQDPMIVWFSTVIGCCFEPDEELNINDDEVFTYYGSNFTSPWRKTLVDWTIDDEAAGALTTQPFVELSERPAKTPPTGRLSSYVVLQSWYSVDRSDYLIFLSAEHLCLVDEKLDNYTIYSSFYSVGNESVVEVEFLDTRFLSDFMGKWWLPFPKLTVRVMLQTQEEFDNKTRGYPLEERVCNPSYDGLVSCLYREKGEGGWADIDGVPLVVDLSTAPVDPAEEYIIQVEVHVDYQGTLELANKYKPYNPIIPPACLSIGLSDVKKKYGIWENKLPVVPFFGTRPATPSPFTDPSPVPAKPKDDDEIALLVVCIFLIIFGVIALVALVYLCARNRKLDAWADNPQLKESLLCGNQHDVEAVEEYRSGRTTENTSRTNTFRAGQV